MTSGYYYKKNKSANGIHAIYSIRTVLNGGLKSISFYKNVMRKVWPQKFIFFCPHLMKTKQAQNLPLCNLHGHLSFETNIISLFSRKNI